MESANMFIATTYNDAANQRVKTDLKSESQSTS